jgi:hypothetical protein
MVWVAAAVDPLLAAGFLVASRGAASTSPRELAA